jgi:hypothetical protein
MATTSSSMYNTGAARPGKDVRWYIESVDGALTDYMRDLLIDYSKVPSDDLLQHLYAVVSRLSSQQEEIICSPLSFEEGDAVGAGFLSLRGVLELPQVEFA